MVLAEMHTPKGIDISEFVSNARRIRGLVDGVIIPGMDDEASARYTEGPVSFNLTWVLLTFLGIFGVHRFYMGKWITGLIWFFTGGLLLLGVLYDYWTLNDQISETNEGRL